MEINKNTKFFLFCASFLFIMILCNEIHVCVEARHLRTHHHCKQCLKGSKKSSETKGKTSLQLNNIGATSAAVQGSKVERAEDFRPTAPGRSPGVGHSIQN